MNKKKVLLLGSSGMLGSMLLDFLSEKQDLDLIATSRDDQFILKAKIKYKNTKFLNFKADYAPPNISEEVDYIVNAIGIIKPYIKDDNEASVEEAILVNSLSPHILSENFKDTPIIKVATDCVFSGSTGHYSETDPHDPLDVYGKTQSLGEVKSENYTNIRCSLIGPERRNKVSLLEWFLAQKKREKVKGFKNHNWNGITTLHFAKATYALITGKTKLPNTLHFIPKDTLNKYELLNLFSKYFNRSDLSISSISADKSVDRTLSTNHLEIIKNVWKEMGYSHAPSIEEMIEELSEYIVSKDFYNL